MANSIFIRAIEEQILEANKEYWDRVNLMLVLDGRKVLNLISKETD